VRLWTPRSGLPTRHVTKARVIDGTLYVSSRAGLVALGPDLVPHRVALQGDHRVEVVDFQPLGDGWLVEGGSGEVAWFAHGKRHEVDLRERGGQLVRGPDGRVYAEENHGFQAVEPHRVGPWMPWPKGEELFAAGAEPSGALDFATPRRWWRWNGAFTVVADMPRDCDSPLLRPATGWLACGRTLWKRHADQWDESPVGSDGSLMRSVLVAGDEVWSATVKGLFRVRPALSLEPESGLPPVQFLWGDTLARYGSWLVALTGQGVLWVRPSGVLAERRVPGARIEAARTPAGARLNPFSLDPDDRFLRVDLASDSLAGRARVDWRFSLDGQWSSLFHEPTVQLPALSPGPHRLSVEASAWGGKWSEPATLAFQVPPHWFERTDVRLGALLAALLVAGLVWRERTRRLAAQVRRLEEREAFRQVFGRFVAPEVADEVLAGRLTDRGERREVTVLFADIRGFTPLSESLEPERLVEVLNRWFTVMVERIEAEGGVVNKFMGDAVVAIFGAPRALDDHADRAVRAARAMLAAEGELLQAPGAPALRCGIGVNTGRVVAGPVGATSRMEYTVIGEAVNVAARVEALTRKLDASVLVTRATRDRLRDARGLVGAGTHRLKGVSEPVEVFRLAAAMAVRPAG
jgi:Adenylate cyclase, family 3 (some proteins contain HAMP domain)